ncbi:MAG: hypothetical protein U9N19_05135 [Thermodesulfobacteriota bacterium]|nr:hypothetical protein [Thermodesulfobacteriota bacterium]
MDKKEDCSEIKSWTEWYDKYYDNPLLKMAYAIKGVPIPYQVIASTIEDVWKKLRANDDSTLLDVGVGVGLLIGFYVIAFFTILPT